MVSSLGLYSTFQQFTVSWFIFSCYGLWWWDRLAAFCEIQKWAGPISQTAHFGRFKVVTADVKPLQWKYSTEYQGTYTAVWQPEILPYAFFRFQAKGAWNVYVRCIGNGWRNPGLSRCRQCGEDTAAQRPQRRGQTVWKQHGVGSVETTSTHGDCRLHVLKQAPFFACTTRKAEEKNTYSKDKTPIQTFSND